MKNRPVMLIICDGMGIGEENSANAFYMAKKNTFEMLKNCPKTTISASGEDVGLPKGQMGNSEVGHLNIGAGRIVYQDLLRIGNAISDGSFYSNPALLNVMEYCKENGKALHLMGIFSNGGVHGHNSHLFALIKLARKMGIEEVYIHLITDGRDVSIDSSIVDLEELKGVIEEYGGKIASIIGRFYAMDMDNRWERIKAAYDLYTIGGKVYSTPEEAIKDNYNREIYDEFIEPSSIGEVRTIKKGEGLIFYNFRPDRARQLIHAFADEEFDKFNRDYLNLKIATMTSYDETIKNVEVAFSSEIPEKTLGEVVAKNGLTQLRIAETEKYHHVTYFINGGREEVFPGEDRILIPSPKVKTYDLMPEMSAYEVTDRACEAIESEKYELIILNFANPDMVGHTGVTSAAIKAVETVDTCLGKILKSLDRVGGVALVTADHGNCELMELNGSVVTSHTTNPVNLFLYGLDGELNPGRLSDLAPTILDIMGIEKTVEMTGVSLRRK